MVRSGVSRTTFYYHYGNLEQLAENSIVNECMRKDMIILIHQIVSNKSLNDISVSSSEVLNRRFRRLELATGPHGTLKFLEVIKGCFMDIARAELVSKIFKDLKGSMHNGTLADFWRESETEAD